MLGTQSKVQLPEASASFSQEAGRVVFISRVDGNPEVYLMDGNGRNKERLTENNTYESSPSWSPNGKQIVFLSYTEQHKSLDLMDLETRVITHLLNTTEFLQYPIWSPDGEWIVFGKSGELFLISPDLEHEVQITDFGYSYSLTPLAWSNDSERILFSSNHEIPGHAVSEMRLYSLNVGEQVIEAITDKQFTYLQSADWSPNEQAIVYSMGLHSRILYMWNIYNDDTVELVSIQHTDILSSRRNETDAKWLPDGQHVIFSMLDHEDNQDIYILNILTNELNRLTDDSAHDSQPAWWSP